MQQEELKQLVLSELDPPLNVSLISTVSELSALETFFKSIKEQPVPQLGWDMETTPLKDYFFRRARTLQFGNHESQYVIDLLPFCNYDPELLFACQGYYGKNITPQLRELLDFIKPVICTDDFLKVGVNLGFEYQMHYWLFGMRPWHFYDCMMAEKCIWAGAHSLKDYAFYSMDGMMSRYFRVQIDKTLQTSFTLDGILSSGQIDYGALDTRFPIGIKSLQTVVASGKHFFEMGPKMRSIFENFEPKKSGSGEPVILGDDLNEIIQIENDAVGFFEDMYVHGERLDRDKWLANVAVAKKDLKELIDTVLDPIFMPIVGSKSKMPTDAEILDAETLWKSFNSVSDTEIELKSKRRVANKNKEFEIVAAIDAQLLELEAKRKSDKEIYKTACSDMKKLRTKIKNLASKCEGEALINYGSDTQLLAAVQTIKGLKSVKSMDDEVLEKYGDAGYSVMSAIRKLHGLQKQIGTYGDQWATEWTTKPCKEEGWLHPGDGRLHCVFNQYDAETGRSSSEKPNGQNLPQDESVRSCFIADPPNENIRVSKCCDADTNLTIHPINVSQPAYECTKCGKVYELHETLPEEYVIVTADMSGAELRIIAEEAEDPVWVGAFSRGEDVHSVGTEILYEDEWPLGTVNGDLQKNKKTGNMEPYFCEYFKLHTEDTVAKFPNTTVGAPMHQKCNCPEHKERRDENKATNFLLAYGGGPHTLSKRIKKTLEKAQELMALHAQKFPRIWAYLSDSGKKAYMMKRAFDMFGRRRLFPDPTWDSAKARFISDNEELLRIPESEAATKLSLFESYHNRKPTSEEEYVLTHREPDGKEIGKTLKIMNSSIERQGKNHPIQSTNATIIKLAAGCGFDKNGKPYLWHIFPKFRAIVLKMVHDELVVQSPKHKAKEVAWEIGDAFARAAATKMKLVRMEFDYNIAPYWRK